MGGGRRRDRRPPPILRSLTKPLLIRLKNSRAQAAVVSRSTQQHVAGGREELARHSPELSAHPLLPLLDSRQRPEAPQGVRSSLTVHGSHNLSQIPKADSRCSPLREAAEAPWIRTVRELRLGSRSVRASQTPLWSWVGRLRVVACVDDVQVRYVHQPLHEPAREVGSSLPRFVQGLLRRLKCF